MPRTEASGILPAEAIPKPKLKINTNVQDQGWVKQPTTAVSFGSPKGTFDEGYKQGFIDGYFKGYNQAIGHETPVSAREATSFPLNLTEDFREGYVGGEEEGYLKGREAGFEVEPGEKPKLLRVLNPDSKSKGNDDEELTPTTPRILRVVNQDPEVTSREDVVEPAKVLRVTNPDIG